MEKKQVVIMLILIMAMAITACRKENDAVESATVGSVMDIENIMEEIQTEDVEEEPNNSETEVSAESEKVNTQSEGAIKSEANTNAQVNQQLAETVGEPSEEQQADEQPMEQPVEQAEQQVQEQIEPSIPTATLNGHIDSVGNEEFVIRKSDVVNSDVIVSSGEDAETVSVIYKDSTEFVLCSTSDGGITADYNSASSSDLCNDSMVEIQGFYEENYFVAKKVTIYNFQ